MIAIAQSTMLRPRPVLDRALPTPAATAESSGCSNLWMQKIPNFPPCAAFSVGHKHKLQRPLDTMRGLTLPNRQGPLPQDSLAQNLMSDASNLAAEGRVQVPKSVQHY